MKRLALSLTLATILLATSSCGNKETTPGHTPGLGEIMTLIQMRHTKLCLAGEAKNWALAAYEVDEIKEGLHDIVTYHPTHKTSPVSIAEVTPQQTDASIKALDEAIKSKNSKAFDQAFDAFTFSCNSCHAATGFEFNVVVRPKVNPFPNQSFAPPEEGK